MSELQALSASIAAAAERVGPSLVAVGRGTGIVVGRGRVLTNAHNLRGPQVRVGSADGRTSEGALAGADLEGDLAVVEVDTGDAPPIAWADGDTSIGTVVLALAPTRSGARVTVGTVSATGQAFRGPRGRPITDAFEHTAPMARGSSGGPVVDASGALLGINTHRRSDGFYLAVPATAELRRRVDALAAGETRTRPRLGIAVAPARIAQRMRAAVGLDDRTGLLVREVEPGSPAADAGIRRGDLLVAVDEREIVESDDLFALLDDLDPEATLTVGVIRGTQELTVAVRFAGAAAEGDA